MSKTLLFIPMYNCENQIPRVLSKLSSELLLYIDEVLMIDNGSSDSTLLHAIESSNNLDCNITIAKNIDNYSLGGSIKNAIKYALENSYDYIIVLHGDDQANPIDLLSVLKNGSFQKNDLSIGARFHPESVLEGYSLFRTIGNKTFNILFSWIVGHKIYDMIAGINIYKLDIFKDLKFMDFPNNLTFDAHLLLYSCYKKLNIEFFPITWADDDQVSNARVFNQAKIILKLLIQYKLYGRKIFDSLDSSMYQNMSFEIKHKKRV